MGSFSLSPTHHAVIKFITESKVDCYRELPGDFAPKDGDGDVIMMILKTYHYKNSGIMGYAMRREIKSA